MENLIAAVFRLVFRVVLLALGLVFVASLVFAAAFVFALWGLRSVWARLRGRPVTPMAFQFNPRAQWGRFSGGGRAAPEDRGASGPRANQDAIGDITDVVPKSSPAAPSSHSP